MSHTPGESSASNELHVSPDEDQAVARVEVLRRKELVDKINYVNFLGRSLAAVFGHATYGSELAVPVVPQPCSGSTLDCTWQAGSAAPGGGFTLQRLEIQERDGTVHIVPEEFRVGDLGISVSLPEESSIVVPVATVRYEARDVEVYLIQMASASVSSSWTTPLGTSGCGQRTRTPSDTIFSTATTKSPS
jgi:hypothetical protein